MWEAVLTLFLKVQKGERKRKEKREVLKIPVIPLTGMASDPPELHS